MKSYIWSYLGALVLMSLRYFIVAGAAYGIFWKLLDKRLRAKRIQESTPSGKDLKRELGWSLSTLLVFGFVGAAVHWMHKGGYAQFYWRVSDRGWTYFWISVILMILLHDTYFYWTHRWMHLPKVFPKVHRVHHVSTNPTPWAAFAFHPLEAVVQGAILPLILLLIPSHPGALGVFLSYMILLNVWGHLGYEFFPRDFPKGRLTRWHNSSTHHNLHHLKGGGHYSLYLNFWDRLMETNRPDYPEDFAKVKAGEALGPEKEGV